MHTSNGDLLSLLNIHVSDCLFNTCLDIWQASQTHGAQARMFLATPWPASPQPANPLATDFRTPVKEDPLLTTAKMQIHSALYFVLSLTSHCESEMLPFHLPKTPAILFPLLLASAGISTCFCSDLGTWLPMANLLPLFLPFQLVSRSKFFLNIPHPQTCQWLCFKVTDSGARGRLSC